MLAWRQGKDWSNEVHNICKYFNIDSDLVATTVAKSAEGMWNPLKGIRGGHPFSGGCLPKDTKAFQYFCNKLGLSQYLLDTTIRVNENMKESDLALSQRQTVIRSNQPNIKHEGYS